MTNAIVHFGGLIVSKSRCEKLLSSCADELSFKKIIGNSTCNSWIQIIQQTTRCCSVILECPKALQDTNRISCWFQTLSSLPTVLLLHAHRESMASQIQRILLLWEVPQLIGLIGLVCLAFESLAAIGAYVFHQYSQEKISNRLYSYMFVILVYI
jgi:hypothetical protein